MSADEDLERTERRIDQLRDEVSILRTQLAHKERMLSNTKELRDALRRLPAE